MLKSLSLNTLFYSGRVEWEYLVPFDTFPLSFTNFLQKSILLICAIIDKIHQKDLDLLQFAENYSFCVQRVGKTDCAFFWKRNIIMSSHTEIYQIVESKECKRVLTQKQMWNKSPHKNGLNSVVLLKVKLIDVYKTLENMLQKFVSSVRLNACTGTISINVFPSTEIL